MKIGITTRPLQANYGGILQNYALQQALKRLGHEAITIDLVPSYSLYRYLRSLCKTLLLWPIPWKRRKFVSYGTASSRSNAIEKFCKNHIALTKPLHRYQSLLVEQYDLEAVITGSDQVWRSKYNRYAGHLEDMFLRFVSKPNVKKLAYAASFGIDEWDYSPELTKECSRLAKEFMAISVREGSGIVLCNKHLDVEAIQVIHPTLLLDKADYEQLCADIPVESTPFTAVYVLDKSLPKMQLIQKLASEIGLPTKIFSAHHGMTLSIEEWLAMFRDARYLITDSFHGTAFSIIFNKPFVAIGNENRGMTRFNSLLSLFGLKERLYVSDKECDTSTNIDWEAVNIERKNLQDDAFDFLRLLDK